MSHLEIVPGCPWRWLQENVHGMASKVNRGRSSLGEGRMQGNGTPRRPAARALAWLTNSQPVPRKPHLEKPYPLHWVTVSSAWPHLACSTTWETMGWGFAAGMGGTTWDTSEGLGSRPGSASLAVMAQVSATHRENLDWILSSWLWPGPALTVVNGSPLCVPL